LLFGSMLTDGPAGGLPHALGDALAPALWT
jgi:hypothetical protein